MRALFLKYDILWVTLPTIMRHDHTSEIENIAIHRMWCCQYMLCQLILDELLPLQRAPECLCSLYVPRLGLWTCGHDTSCLASLSLWVNSLAEAILTDQWFFPYTPTKEVKWTFQTYFLDSKRKLNYKQQYPKGWREISHRNVSWRVKEGT